MLKVSGVSKSYGPVRAVQNVSIEFQPGEIHAVLGENGAGKSTLMHILAGLTVPDAGSVWLNGKTVPPGRPFQSKARGIAMIHQHFTLVPAFTVEENLALANLSSVGPISQQSLAKPGIDEARALGWQLDPHARAGQLPVGAQQRVEILKSLSNDCQVAIFDEPTAVLGPDEIDDVFGVLRKLKAEGKVVILIAHKLQEVMAVADRVTVLRRGEMLAHAAISQVTPTILAEWMVGELPPPLQSGAGTTLGPGLSLKGVTAKGDRGEPALQGVDIEVQRGEILGIGGVDGNGQIELAEVIVGIRQHGGDLAWAENQKPKIAYIPQDRQSDGLALSMSIEDNFLIEGHRRPALTKGPFIRRHAARDWAHGLVERFGIKVGSIRDEVASLSGGNQQKVVVARALDETPDILVAANPSRGLDVKATEYVHRKILEARNAGAAVVLISTDHDELAALSTRTIYLSAGQIVSSLLGGHS
jgi:general nucleoside transport system ATP-binding protein